MSFKILKSPLNINTYCCFIFGKNDNFMPNPYTLHGIPPSPILSFYWVYLFFLPNFWHWKTKFKNCVTEPPKKWTSVWTICKIFNRKLKLFFKQIISRSHNTKVHNFIFSFLLRHHKVVITKWPDIILVLCLLWKLFCHSCNKVYHPNTFSVTIQKVKN